MIEIIDDEHIVATPLMQYKARPATLQTRVIEIEDMDIFEDLSVTGTRPAHLSSTGVPTIKLEQRPGEVLLVPSGWGYQFTNPPTVTPTTSRFSWPEIEAPNGR